MSGCQHVGDVTHRNILSVNASHAAAERRALVLSMTYQNKAVTGSFSAIVQT